MIATKPEVAVDGWYTQAQTARVLGVDRHTIKKYTVNGLLKSRIRRADKKELINGKQILQFWERFIF